MQMKQVPKMKQKEIEKEGAEWQSELEKKAASKGYSNGYTSEYVAMRDKIQRTGSEYYKHLTSFKHLTYFMVNDFEVFAASEKDAIEIYTLASKK
jgi:predicted site-specific integrase-resolvase